MAHLFISCHGWKTSACRFYSISLSLSALSVLFRSSLFISFSQSSDISSYTPFPSLKRFVVTSYLSQYLLRSIVVLTPNLLPRGSAYVRQPIEAIEAIKSIHQFYHNYCSAGQFFTSKYANTPRNVPFFYLIIFSHTHPFIQCQLGLDVYQPTLLLFLSFCLVPSSAPLRQRSPRWQVDTFACTSCQGKTLVHSTDSSDGEQSRCSGGCVAPITVQLCSSARCLRCSNTGVVQQRDLRSDVALLGFSGQWFASLFYFLQAARDPGLRPDPVHLFRESRYYCLAKPS